MATPISARISRTTRSLVRALELVDASGVMKRIDRSVNSGPKTCRTNSPDFHSSRAILAIEMILDFSISHAQMPSKPRLSAPSDFPLPRWTGPSSALRPDLSPKHPARTAHKPPTERTQP